MDKKAITKRFLQIKNELIVTKKAKNEKDFAAKIGMTSSSMTEISKGRTYLGLMPMLNTIQEFGVSLNWMIRGTGSKYGNEVIADQEQLKLKDKEISSLRNENERLSKQNNELKDQLISALLNKKDPVLKKIFKV